MEVFAIFEGTWAVGVMTIVFTIGLLGVAGLGWYVVRCDAQNRHAERDLLASDGHAVVKKPIVQEVDPLAMDSAPPVANAEPAPAPPHRPRRKH